MRVVPGIAVALAVGTGSGVRAGDAPARPAAGEVVLREALRIDRVGTAARSLVHTDAVEALVVAGEWRPPAAGAELYLPDGTMRRWTKVVADEAGAFEGDVARDGAYLSFRVRSGEERVMLLHGVGHDFVYVNGELRPGDPYGYGWLRLPVLLKQGDNDLLFRASRGRFRARLVAPPSPAFVSADDATVPDGDPRAMRAEGHVAVVVVNAGRAPFRGLLAVRDPGRVVLGEAAAAVPALSCAKVPLEVVMVGPRTAPGELDVRLVERSFPAAPAGEADAVPSVPIPSAFSSVRIPFDVPAEGEPRRRTYVSRVDGSVQEFAFRAPPRPTSVVLSLHGASVEALAQARAYAPHPTALLVCPTNRRPFGFDWETWGRRDALDVLDQAQSRVSDPTRTYLTGHSMGGHGTWHLGVLFPDRFAAIGPSAGWESFATYPRPSTASDDALGAMLRRAASPSDTALFLTNLRGRAVYVLHGDADDNVPVSEARRLAPRAREAGADVTVHEQPGAGHWWDLPETPGADCVDWPPMWQTFAGRRLPLASEVRSVDFVTPDPAVSGRCHWVSVEAQQRSRVPSRVRAEVDRVARRVRGTTENVAVLGLDLSAEDVGPWRIELDGQVRSQELPADRDGTLRLRREEGGWAAASVVPEHKTSARCGPFEAAFDHRFALVVATKGTPEENAWAAAKARFDAESWYYRANGSPDVVTDVEVASSPASFDGRNLVLYGHRQMNAAWEPLLAGSPVQVERGAVRVGDREVKGDGLAALFVRPRAGTEAQSVGVVAGTGMPGLRLTDRLPYFTSGVGVPDLVVVSTEMLSKGEAGLVAAGFFGPDWGLSTGEVAWR